MEAQNNTAKMGRGRPKGSTKNKNGKIKTNEIKNNNKKIENKSKNKKINTENFSIPNTDKNSKSEKIKTKRNEKIINLTRDPNTTKISPIIIKIW